jgi:hypothetical protein
LSSALWSIWAFLQTFKIASAGRALRRARRHAGEFPLEVESRLEQWARVRHTGRRTRLVLSNQVRAAAVLGGRSPVIGIAPALVEHLSDADLDRVVIHEWAHVQRRDDLAIVGQALIRLVAGWQPAWWWLERQLQIEREAACDARAIAVTGSAREYATCLTMVASLPAPSIRPVSLLAVHSSTGLRARVLRILAAPMIGSWRSSGAIAMAAALLPACAAWSVGGVRLVEAHSLTVPTALAQLASPVSAAASRPPGPPGPPGPSAPLAFDEQPASRKVLPPAPARVRVPDGEARGEIQPESNRPTSASALDASLSPVGPSAPARPPEHDLFASLTAVGLPVDVSPSSPVVPPVVVGPEPMQTVAAQAAPRIATPPATPITAQPTPAWELAADAGKTLGRGTAKAAVATAGFFSRFGKSVARSF